MVKTRSKSISSPKNQVSICQDCGAACCKYVSIFIAKPTTRQDFDNLRWYLAHEGVCVFQDRDRDWAVIVPTRCRFLSTDNLCAMYDTRPEACRDYSAEACENTDTDGEYLLYFESVEELEHYLDQRWSRSPRRKSKPRRKRSAS